MSGEWAAAVGWAAKSQTQWSRCVTLMAAAAVAAAATDEIGHTRRSSSGVSNVDARR